MKNLEKRINIDHIFIHSFFQMMAGIVYGFGVFILINRGYSSGQAGLCMSLASIFCFFVAPTISNFLDNSDKVSAFEAVVLLSLVITCLYGVNYFLGSKCLLLSIVFILAHGFYSAQEPCINSMSSKFIANGLNIGFTTARAAGSFSYGLVCAIFGILTQNHSYKIVIIGGIIFSFLTAMITLRIRSNYKLYDKRDLESVNKEENVSFKDFLKNNKLFLVLCVFLTGLFIGYTSTDNFMLLITENVGGNSSDMGLILAFKALVEAISIFMFPVFLKHIKLDNLLKISAISFVIKQAVFCIAPNVFFLYIGQCFQMISFAIIFPGMVEYVNVNLKKKETYRGNAIFTQTISIGSIISSVLAGNIAEIYGVPTMNVVALLITIASAIGFVLTIIYKNKRAI